MIRIGFATLFLATFGAGMALPAAAQDAEPEPTVNQVIVYGDQPCPVPTSDEIVVCVRQEDPYRIPTPLRQSESKKNEAWASRVTANRDVGATGVGSCTVIGPEGSTGCTQAIIEQAYAEKSGGSDVQMARLVAEARAARLAEIDEDAQAEQERVEAIESEYEARRKAQEAEEAGDGAKDGADEAAPPVVVAE